MSEETPRIAYITSSGDTKTALDLVMQGIFLFNDILRLYPNSIQVSDAAGACWKMYDILSPLVNENGTMQLEQRGSMAEELGELEKCAIFFDGIKSNPDPNIPRKIRLLLSDISSAVGIDPSLPVSYSETTNLTPGERTETHRQKIGQSEQREKIKAQEEEALAFITALPREFSPETTRGEKLISSIYSQCGVIQGICDGLDQQLIVWGTTVAREAALTLQAIGRLLEHLPERFIENYLQDKVKTDFRALYGKLKNSATYSPISPSLISQLNQEITPIREILFRHTGEETYKQKEVIRNYDQMIDIYKKDMDGLRTDPHPITWGTGILIAVRMSLLTENIWPATWIGMLSMLLFAIPFAVLWKRNFESSTKGINIEYPDTSDFWVTKTHLNDRIAETRKSIIKNMSQAVDDRRKDKKHAETLWFIIAPTVAALNAISSSLGWI